MNWAPALVAGGLGGKATAPVMGQDHQKLQRMFHLSSNERPDGLDGHFGGIDVIRVISADNYDRLNQVRAPASADAQCTKHPLWAIRAHLSSSKPEKIRLNCRNKS